MLYRKLKIDYRKKRMLKTGRFQSPLLSSQWSDFTTAQSLYWSNAMIVETIGQALV